MGRRQRPCGVVHEDELRIPDGGQRETNGLRAIGAARNDDRVATEDELGLIGAIRRNGDHDVVDDAGVTQTTQGVLQHRTTSEVDECLWRASRQPFPGPCCRDDGDRAHASGRGGQNLVEDGLGLGVVGVLRERQLADKDLPGLRQHPLLARGQAPLLVTSP